MDISKDSYIAAKTLLGNGRRILISGHLSPDGDSLGSMIALARLLRKFGKDAFGWLEIDAPAAGLEYFMNIGEILWEETGLVDRKPGRCIRACGVKWHTEKSGFQRVPVAPDLRNLFTAGEGSPVRIPEKFGIVTPFRAVEFYRADFPVNAKTVRRFVISYPADRTESSFACDDETLNRIWQVGAYTLELTCREVFIEGVKRDHWVWSGDAVQSFLMNYYLYGDRQLVKDAIWYLRGGDPVVMHVNQIMDYTFYWFTSIRDYWLFTGDAAFVKQAWTRMTSLMDFAISRLDRCGRPHADRGDWMFIDWAPEPLHNYGGVTSFEQMLFVRALEAMAELGKVAGAPEKLLGMYRVRAQKLKLEVVPLFWSDEKGALMHLLKDDGTLDPQLTRYPNMFGLFYGYFTPEEAERVAKNVILGDKVMKIQTPYMRFYELESLCTLGRQEDVMKAMLEYWGGMLDEGATSFWELYNTDEKGLDKYAMYGRSYGKSLCHAWGASPIYLLGRYYLGVEPVKPGFAEYEVKPCLGGLKWMEGDVPTPSGPVHVRVDEKGVRVTGNGGVGKLVWKGRTVAVPPRAVVSLP